MHKNLNSLRNRACSMNDVENAFRGYMRIASAKEHASTKGTSSWDIELVGHDKRVRIVKRADGLMFVNCAGRTALVSRSIRALRTEVSKALR